MLILGSTSPIRAQLLEAAGVAFEARRPDFDEDVVKALHDGTPDMLAIKLAHGKALSIETASDVVIGGDSVLEVEGRLFDKPEDRAQAAAHLRFFSGKTMHLHSAVCLARGGEIVWSHVDRVELDVRALSPAFIDTYLDAEWPEVGYCVGVFRMEGRGVTLFDAVRGSHFTILGLPLLPLLGALRDLEILPR